MCVHIPFRLNPIASLAWLGKQLPCPLLKNENGVKSTIQTDPCDYKVHTHTHTHTRTLFPAPVERNKKPNASQNHIMGPLLLFAPKIIHDKVTPYSRNNNECIVYKENDNSDI